MLGAELMLGKFHSSKEKEKAMDDLIHGGGGLGIVNCWTIHCSSSGSEV